MSVPKGNKNAVKETKREFLVSTHGTLNEVETWRQKAKDTGKKLAAWVRDRLNA